MKTTVFFIICVSVFLRMRNFSDESFRGNQNTHFVFNNFFFENRVFFQIIWKNIVQPDRPQMTIRRMRIASRILQTHTQNM